MATMIQAESVSTVYLKDFAVVDVHELPTATKPALLITYNDGEEDIVRIFADVLGQSWESATSVDEAREGPQSTIYGLKNTLAGSQLDGWDRSRLLISTHCVDAGHPHEDTLAERCDYEYLYTRSPFFRRDVARFLSFILGQIGPHRDLTQKARTTLISTTFPDVHAALPNLDILSVGADAIEIRVDLLEEPLPDGSFSKIPSLKYVGEQVMLLRQRTELPIIYTTRCTNENGRFPMDDPWLFFQYLSRAIQWGCEYIDVELWLPEDIRRRLAEMKGNSKIISAFHDFSGTFKWTAPETQRLFEKGAVFGDVVKMYAMVNSVQENYELEYFRSTIRAKYPHPPFSGLNMGSMGQLSRTLNKIFTPITHPLLPLIAAPGQLSAAEINSALHSMGQMPKLDIYGIGSFRSTSQAMFFEKCFNELSLPHSFMFAERAPKASIENILRRPNFGGAYIDPPLAASTAASAYLPALSNAARVIGQVDTVLVRSEAGRPTFVGDNARWKGIRSTLSRDFVPSAYSGRAALVLASTEGDAAAAIFALKSLGIGPVYTIGFKAHGSLAVDVEPVRSVEDVKRLEQPFVIISALPAEKSLLVVPLLKHYRVDGRNGTPNSNGNGVTTRRGAGKVFVDLASGPRKADPLAVATSAGWTAYGIADVSAWTTVETLRLLVGQNVSYDFVRLASGRGLF
ncbi:type I 3-dehydroquinase-domain-containing protein [Massariosphaeria phaeospora]|uniref:Type I 3-dehydroquinase-domain-containing protein n=1 Tax=Massariosphaeria phaeospora TaxID=100035 RepID=A0A7C8MQJ9_9PLEO|nr:type I 3-dehydroquinase-domain-containing protein [Massariosphaeria phaeospora]